MKKKYFILALTFLCLLIGQSSYSQDWFDDDGYTWDWDDDDDDDDNDYDAPSYNPCDPNTFDFCQCYGNCLDEIPIGPCALGSSTYDPCVCNPSSCDSMNPCDVTSSAYDPCICNPYSCDSGNPCDTSSSAYDPCICNPYGCDSGDPCDASSSAYDSCICDPPSCVNNDQTPIPDPCTTASIAAGVAATSFFANHVLQQANNFSPFTFNQSQNEEWFMIENNNGVISPSPIITVSPNGGTVQISRNAIADNHTHTDGGYARPSAEDLWQLGDSRAFASNFSDSYITAFDGTKYSLHITDANLLTTFMATNGVFYDSNSNDFLQSSVLYTTFNRAYTSLSINNPNMSIFEAQERAFAFILKDSGVDLLKANSGSNEFKKIDITPAKKPDGTIKKDANGNPIYENADCN